MRRGAAGALLLLAVALPAAARDGAEWLQRMTTALATLDYQGSLVYIRDGHVDALQLWHRVDDDGTHERLLALSGVPRELNRRAGLAWLTDRTLPASASRPAGTVPLDPAALAVTYQIAVSGEDRIAARPVQVLDVRPRDGFRYGYRLWLEHDSGLPLKSVAFASDGRAVEQWMFVEIRIGDVDDAADPALPAPPARRTEPPPRLEPGSARWQVRDVPRGFRLALLSGSETTGEHQVYSDGLARVSLFVEPLGADGPNLSGLLRRGALSMYGRITDGHQVTVVGEVPPATVERIAQGVVAR
jgi:sigma-E factor negative regulatory protein RseB